MENCSTAPILIDALGEGSRYLPGLLANKWPNAQRIELIAEEPSRSILSNPSSTKTEGSGISLDIQGAGILAVWKRTALLLHELPGDTSIGLAPRVSVAKDEAEKQTGK